MPNVGRARLWLTLLALLAFTFQTYVTQTHIHAAPVAGGKQVPGKLDDQASCAVCQAAIHGGHYLTPSAGGFVPLTLSSYGVTIATEIAIFVSVASHSWHSRGPPRI
ncbi:MAG: DUF2946 family protein [Alphaproteobacteria bacterium]|nr:DUF2946 family protein [Alphaproteobacteria bacterium]